MNTLLTWLLTILLRIMTRKKLTEAVRNAALAVGFDFQTGFDYRIAPEIKKLPTAWLHPPTLKKKEGRNEGFVVYLVKIDLIDDYANADANQKEIKWNALEKNANQICTHIAKDDNIQTLTDVTLSPAELSLTAKGEISLSLSFNVRMPFCEYCNGNL